LGSPGKGKAMMIVECTGLPGSGKTTICNLVTLPYGKKGSVQLRDTRLNSALVRASWNILLLCCATRPFRINRLKRGLNLVVFLRHYQHRERAILLDQGQVQKLWSILSDANSHSSRRLQKLMASLKPFAPDVVIWVETPVAEAVERVGARTHGISRYDGLSSEIAHAQLSARAKLLQYLAIQYCSITATELQQLDGMLAPEENARKINMILKARN
jgi:thymidylate kinase